MKTIVSITILTAFFAAVELGHGAPSRIIYSTGVKNIDPGFDDRSRNEDRSHRYSVTRHPVDSSSDVKTTSRRKSHSDKIPNGAGIRAYGLPKMFLEENGQIERLEKLNSDRTDEKILTKNRNGRSIEVYGLPKRNLENSGIIEKVSSYESDSSSSIPAGEGTRMYEMGLKKGTAKGRTTRSLRKTDANDIEDPDDLVVEESKVFRPLFVYRKQVADRYRVPRRNDPIYGAYQYPRWESNRPGVRPKSLNYRPRY